MDGDLIYIVAGEQSGDVLGARLIAALRAARPELRFAGIGGPLMAAQGVESLFPLNELAIMGLLEVLPRIWHLRRLLHAAAADVAARRPAVLVTIDSPGFTLRLLKLVGGTVKRAHYVAPQVWAWREHRVRHFPGLWDRLLCLLPFEPEYFARHGLPAVFVGHPVLESGAGDGDGARFRAAHGLAPDAPVLVLMPGSRRSEVARLLPVLAETLALLTPALPGLIAVLPVASAVAGTVRAATAAWPVPPIIVSAIEAKHDAFAAASAAVTKSGTSTLELALAGVPMVVTYRVNPLTAMIARRLVKIRFAAMVNLLADRELVPELIQQDSTAAKLAAAVRPLLADKQAGAAQRAAVAPVLASLAAPSGTPSQAAAAQVLELLRK
ncbi:MAG TPA: lipid-A-disaccharide synthase [Acetobacteraceae bacterium]|nr:lipid-A-disaccharide synthase [Acetobacteraceae bacterium]